MDAEEAHKVEEMDRGRGIGQDGCRRTKAKKVFRVTCI